MYFKKVSSEYENSKQTQIKKTRSKSYKREWYVEVQVIKKEDDTD